MPRSLISAVALTGLLAWAGQSAAEQSRIAAMGQKSAETAVFKSEGTDKPLASALLSPPKQASALDLSAAGFSRGGTIPFHFSAYGDNVSPALHWDNGPAGTRSFALLVEDPDAPSPIPFVHWILFNLPAETKSLPEGLTKSGMLESPKGALQGTNSPGKIGYFGPRPPAGPAHHYHFQLFALDTMLDIRPGLDREGLIDAMEGHVLAEDDLVGLFKMPAGTAH